MLKRIARAIRHVHERVTGKVPAGSARSPHWHTLEKKVVAEVGACEACGRTKHLEVHHVEEFSRRPELELERTNLVVLCRRCHELLGHLDSWRSFNSEVVKDARHWRQKIENRPAPQHKKAA